MAEEEPVPEKRKRRGGREYLAERVLKIARGAGMRDMEASVALIEIVAGAIKDLEARQLVQFAADVDAVWAKYALPRVQQSGAIVTPLQRPTLW